MIKKITISLMVFTVIFAIGPRPTFEPRYQSIHLPDNLKAIEQQINNTEKPTAGLIGELARRIEWANPDNPSVTPLSVIYIHGFSASHKELYPIPQEVAQALNANLYLARLPGHGQGYSGMQKATAEDWAFETVSAFQIGEKIGEKVLIITSSTGSTLSTLLLQHNVYQNNLAGIVMVAPNFKVKAPLVSLLTWPWAEYWVPLLVGEKHGFTPQTKEQEQYWTTQYPVHALHEMQSVVDWAQGFTPENIGKPALFLYNDDDHIVDSKMTDTVFQRWQGLKKRIKFSFPADKPMHLIAGDFVAPENNSKVISSIINFYHDIKLQADATTNPATMTINR